MQILDFDRTVREDGDVALLCKKNCRSILHLTCPNRSVGTYLHSRRQTYLTRFMCQCNVVFEVRDQVVVSVRSSVFAKLVVFQQFLHPFAHRDRLFSGYGCLDFSTHLLPLGKGRIL